jgi:dolichol-phosphate mannosyltransferase
MNGSSAPREMKSFKLSVVIPCYNEERTLPAIIERVLAIRDDELDVEIVVVDDHSSDGSARVARAVAAREDRVRVLQHERNRGKGAALRTGFLHTTGDFVAVQDADLEYDPRDLRKLLGPLIAGDADVVLGSRFRSTEASRVLYFWHYVGNRILTLLSNMLTDLNLTDMETCYKVFRREILQSIDLKEDRFGFEPEIVAKIAGMRLRVFEMGISYRGRTYEEGKKIGVKDGFRALYCIFRYNGHKAPWPIQMLVYLGIGLVAAAVNLVLFWAALLGGLEVVPAAALAFGVAALVNYLLCIFLLFRHRARWNSFMELVVFWAAVLAVGALDVGITYSLTEAGMGPLAAKAVATVVCFVLNFAARRWLVFPEPSRGPWRPQVS